MLESLLYFFLALIVMFSHTDDGNIWGIYFKNKSLLVGDFWSALIVIILLVNAILRFKAFIK